MKIALFAGSFDPFTKGHEDLVRRALLLFDKVVVAIGRNTAKQGLFTPEKRAEAIKAFYNKESRVEVLIYSKLTVECCKEAGAAFILRGLRNTNDFDFERAIAQMNHDLDPAIETIFMMTSPEFSHISSTIVRDIIHHRGNPSLFIPEGIAKELKPGL
jgi:pantetheine-phosphate adenylyltransferase